MSKLLSTVVRHLLACGASNDAVAIAVEEIEACVLGQSRDNFEAGYTLGLAESTAQNKEKERERKRAYREVSRDKRKEPKEKVIYKTPLGKGCGENPLCPGTELTPLDAHFDAWYLTYPRREARAAAKKAYKNACKRATPDQLLEGARREAKSGKDRQFTKMPATWLNADCWLDEPEKPKHQVLAGPWKPIESESPKPERTPEQQALIDEQVRKAIKPAWIKSGVNSA